MRAGPAPLSSPLALRLLRRHRLLLPQDIQRALQPIPRPSPVQTSKNKEFENIFAGMTERNANLNLDETRAAYVATVRKWVSAIRACIALACSAAWCARAAASARCVCIRRIQSRQAFSSRRQRQCVSALPSNALPAHS